MLLCALVGTTPLAAQEHPAAPGERGWSAGAQVVPLLTRAAPTALGEDRTEGYLTQPLLAGHAAWRDGRLRLAAVLNLEGLTLRRGELNTGIWGEGYVDRRHPHTFLHEAVAAALLPLGSAGAASLAVGRGFVPFGTDDPMVRPLVKYPANHHLAQVLERALATVAVRRGMAAVEVGVFNGDEPTAPGDVGRLERFGDSWAARVTLYPTAGWEAQASHAWVRSPEARDGSGLDQRKWSASLRYAAAGDANPVSYLLLEWARTTDQDDGIRGARYGSVLAEAALARRGTTLALRFERTERPEEERLGDPFRSPRPHTGAHLLGITRWTILSANLSRQIDLGALRLRPFAEASRLSAREMVRPSFFVPEEFYGSARLWSLSLGARVTAGEVHQRMGRYGAALLPARPPASPHPHR